MKILYRISLFINCIAIVFLLAKGGALIAKKALVLPAKQEKSPGIISNVSNLDETTSCDTICHMLESDITKGTESEKICDIPSSYIGKTRQQIIEILELYKNNPPLDELKKGFTDVELVSFSREDLTIRKLYETHNYYACIVVEDEYLTVYDEFRKEILLYTDINLKNLPSDVQQEILDGKYVKTQKELYDFLESYSS